MHLKKVHVELANIKHGRPSRQQPGGTQLDLFTFVLVTGFLPLVSKALAAILADYFVIAGIRSAGILT